MNSTKIICFYPVKTSCRNKKQKSKFKKRKGGITEEGKGSKKQILVKYIFFWFWIDFASSLEFLLWVRIQKDNSSSDQHKNSFDD